MVTVLITGRMGSGKSQVLDFIKASGGYPIFKADKVARAFLNPQSPCFDDLIKLLGASFLTKDGFFDRKLLAQELFKNTDKLKKVEQMIHPLVRKEFRSFVDKQKNERKKIVFYEAPLLSREALDSKFDCIVLIQSPKNLSLKRLKEKGFREEDIFLRWKAQNKEEDILDLVDFTLSNEGDINSLKQKTENFLIQLKKRFKTV